MEKWLSFQDVLLDVQFTHSDSRREVDISEYIFSHNFDLPVISSNMDTVTDVTMAKAMGLSGAGAALHRFQSIEDNVKQYLASPKTTIGSFGLGHEEFERAVTLGEAGCTTLLLDVAHGACMKAVKQVQALRTILSPDTHIIVGNFANSRTIDDFIYHLGNKHDISGVKVGIGGGAACLTRIQTGHGRPTFSSVVDCVKNYAGIPVIADGGHKTSGDIIKSLAAGAKMVMLGSMLAGTDETPGEVVYDYPRITQDGVDITQKFKKYRGSASQESYEVQGKVAKHRVFEGDSFLVPYKGSVLDVLQQIEGGIRSAMTYSGITTLDELRENAIFGEVSSSGAHESGAHGKT